MVIIRHHEPDGHHEYGDHHKVDIESHITHRGEEKELKFGLPYEQAANALMSAEGYLEYVEKHGYHFTEALAEHVSAMMENANGQEHTWTAMQVKKVMESLGLMPLGETKTEATLGDVTYLANMYYADLYPDPFKEEAACLKAAYKIARDPDGYKGMIFCRWTSDAIGKAMRIDWHKFI